MSKISQINWNLQKSHKAAYRSVYCNWCWCYAIQ